MAKTVSVTPKEFSEIQELEAKCNCRLDGRFDEMRWANGLTFIVGHLEPFEHYTLVVNRDVPAIPWYSRNVHRIS